MCPKVTFEGNFGFLCPCVSPFRTKKNEKIMHFSNFSKVDMSNVFQTYFSGKFWISVPLCQPFPDQKKEKKMHFSNFSKTQYIKYVPNLLLRDMLEFRDPVSVLSDAKKRGNHAFPELPNSTYQMCTSVLKTL